MTDIVKRLRQPPFGTETSERNIMTEAADEIENLRKLVLISGAAVKVGLAQFKIKSKEGE
jgi:hypothetical protein